MGLMWSWVLGLALAAEPGGLPVVVDPPALSVERVIPWAELGLLEAAAESPALGPDRLAVGPDGALAWFNVATAEVQVLDGLVYPVPRCDGLLFLDADTLVVLDDAARQLVVLDLDGTTSWFAMPRMVPPGGTLSRWGHTLVSVDAFGNGHAVAQVSAEGQLQTWAGPRLLNPSHRVERERRAADTVLRLDGEVVKTSPYRMSGRVLGDWLLIEERAPEQAIRTLVPLDGGASVALAAERLYAPSSDLAAGFGRLVWMRPAVDGLHLVEVSP